LSGGSPGSESLAHAQKTLRAARTFDQPLVMVQYRHPLYASEPEAFQRIRGWFREHLLGAAPITHVGDQGSFVLGGGSTN
jgi:hypothetical protein